MFWSSYFCVVSFIQSVVYPRLYTVFLVCFPSLPRQFSYLSFVPPPPPPPPPSRGSSQQTVSTTSWGSGRDWSAPYLTYDPQSHTYWTHTCQRSELAGAVCAVHCILLPCLSLPSPVQITSAYITSRIEAMESVVRDNLENPLDDNTIVTQQLDQMATIGRSVPSSSQFTFFYAVFN